MRGGGFANAALVMVDASFGQLGYTMPPTFVGRAAPKHYSLEECGDDFNAITAERRVRQRVATAITEHTRWQHFECANIPTYSELHPRLFW